MAQLALSFTTDLSGLSQGMSQAADLVQRNAGGMEKAFTSAGNVVGGLERAMVSFKREQVQQGRLVGFYMRELRDVLPMTEGVSRALSGLGSVLFEAGTSGMGLALAFEAVKAGIGIISSIGEESRKQFQESNRVVDDVLKNWTDKVADLNREIAVLRGGSGAGTAYDAQRDLDRVNQEIENLRFKRAGTSEGIFSSRKGYDEQISKLINDRVRLEKQIKEAEDREIARENAASAKKLAEQAAQDAKKAQEDAVRRAKEKAAEEAREYVKEYNAKLKSYSDAAKSSERPYLPGIVGSEVMSAVADRRGEQGRERALYEGGYMPREVAGERSSAAQNARLMAGYQESEKKRLQELAVQWQNYGSKAGEALAGIITGQTSALQILASMLQQMIAVIQQIAIKAIMAHAGSAAAGAAESQAAIPIAGPAMAAAAMTAMFSMVSALVGQIGSAEGGASLPAFVGPRMFALHSEEMVLPKPYANVIRGLASEGGRGGGITLNLSPHVSTLDPRSAQEYLETGFIDMIVRSLARERRAGRF